MRAKILFIDDEQKVLESIENQLFQKQDDWQMDFANSGEQAVRMLEKTAYDVVVSDMRMPGMDGSALLTHVRENYPGIMRIVLSGYAVPEAAIAAIPFAHQYLSKPCKQQTLIDTLENALRIRNASEDPDVRFGVSKIMDLPTHLGVYMELALVLQNENSDFEDAAAVIEKDTALTMKVMFVANSALFATANPAESTYEAVQRLGGEALKMLVLAVEIANLIDDGKDAVSAERRDKQERITQIVGTLLSNHPASQMAGAIAAILHDLGNMVFSNFITDRYEQKVLSQSGCKEERVAQEIKEFGLSYAQLGGLLLRLWRLPDTVIAAVENQHSKNPEDFVDAPVSVSLMLASLIVGDLDVDLNATIDRNSKIDDDLQAALALLPDTDAGSWRERVDAALEVEC